VSNQTEYTEGPCCAAARKVIRLHKPVTATLENFRGPQVSVCSICVEPNYGLVSRRDKYPCATVKVLRGAGEQCRDGACRAAATEIERG
jgi:radical SAM superfamily enzyme with C-terminal helix-hairpin-helix motif